MSTSCQAAGVVRTGEVFSITHCVCTKRDKYGMALRWYYEAVFYARDNPQYPIGYCGHRHRTESKAIECEDKLIGAMADKHLKRPTGPSGRGG